MGASKKKGAKCNKYELNLLVMCSSAYTLIPMVNFPQIHKRYQNYNPDTDRELRDTA